MMTVNEETIEHSLLEGEALTVTESTAGATHTLLTGGAPLDLSRGAVTLVAPLGPS